VKFSHVQLVNSIKLKKKKKTGGITFLTAYIFQTILIIKIKYILQILVITHNTKIHILCTSGINATKFRNIQIISHTKPNTTGNVYII
jgi:hypothetical protein